MTSEAREPVFQAPWPVLALIGAILVAYFAQAHLVPAGWVEGHVLSAQAVRAGRYEVLFTSLFLHGGWAHALVNAGFGLAFASPVARRMGVDLKGVAGFFAFYLLCGAISGLAFVAAHWNDEAAAVGASGAFAGFMGATSRLMSGGWDLAPFRSRPVVSMALSWIIINVIFGLVFVGWAPGSGGAPMAWEAHLGGYFAGLLLLGPMLRLMGRN
ncbi:rhomboid family intramembrane serine protease [Phenylobacterium montanum]|uniref:Rhomboid family intramembrane serine protease n=1 Tax=Phenylobacterium montanum TaxID=2823693 RepID=A0A975G3I2_9CAUL|nr:rhomboid family intramembrane serine protease [Caulobacter sp. S6]QUD89874.1 rhomboid family intramembrane serine protease [Caulobacter sp. S6]